MKGIVLAIGIGVAIVGPLFAQDSLHTHQLKEVEIRGYRTMNGIGHMDEVQRPIVYAGKKTEVILVDSLDTNLAINNTRQVLGRIPGLTIAESETGGFVSNGIGVRGLNPRQSVEMNVRQNGYTLAADIYGYNETYYLPPMEAVHRIEVIKGSASLQFGPQFGGVINYVIKEAPNKPIEVTASITGGSNGLFNSFTSLGGTQGKLGYYGFLQYRSLSGWRENSKQQQFSGYGKLNYKFTDKLSVAHEYSALRNKIQMPGGLTDTQFLTDSRSSFRSRNWVESPWNILTASLNYACGNHSYLTLKSSFLTGQRNLVWFPESPEQEDLIIAGEYQNREVDKETATSISTEVRYMRNFHWGRMNSTLAGGFRFAVARFKRLEEGVGTNGTDMDFNLIGEYEEKFKFQTVNAAPFVEIVIRPTEKFSITPGARLELLNSESEAEIEDELTGDEVETESEKERTFLLGGIGLQYQLGKQTNLYANVTQAYRPIEYAQLVPLGVASVVDPNMKDSKGYSTDIGYRGSWKNILNFDVSVFYMAYNNRVGLEALVDVEGNPYTFRTNVANSIHRGIESYIEGNILKWINGNSKSNVSVFHSLGLVDARYVSGEFKNNRVEYAPNVISRIGVTFSRLGFSTTIQFSQQSKAFGDASNTVVSPNPIIGEIPAYEVFDWSTTLRIKKFSVQAGVNNLLDTRYFSYRTDEYPGPGIISSVGRGVYVGLRVTL